MTRHEKLLENYEDALFALLMDEVAEQEGKRFLAENEQLKQNKKSAIPAEVDKRCLKTIKLTFAKRRRRELGHSVYRTFTHIAVFVIVLMLLIGTAYAVFPEIRIKTLNLVIEISDLASSLSLVEEDNQSSDLNTGTDIVRDEKTLSGYRLPEIPGDFSIVDETHLSSCSWIEYKNELGYEIWIDIYAADGTVVNLDTEDAQNIENIQIHGHDGLLVEKGNRVTIIWGDTDHNYLIMVECIGIDRATTWSYAESVEFVSTP